MRKRNWMILLGVLSILSLLLAIGLGAKYFSPATVWRAFSNHFFAYQGFGEASKMETNMIVTFRFPRVVLGYIVGMNLALCGTCMQALIHNKLADPFILGVSSGASLTASLFMVFGFFSFFGRYALAFSAFLGAMLTIVLVYYLGQVNGRIHIAKLLLAGVAVAMMMDAFTSFTAFAARNLFSMYGVGFWLSGSLAGAKIEYLGLPALVMAVCFIYLMGQYRGLNALSMGAETAQSLGINPDRLSKRLIIVCSLLAGVTISVSGSIGFVGLIAPHIARKLVGADHKYLLPLAIFLGGALVVWSDVLARTLVAPEEVSVGVVTALIGAPFLLIVLKKELHGTKA